MFRTGNILSLLSIMTIISQECITGIPIHMLGQHIVICVRGLIQGHITQIRSWQNFSVKGQIVIILGFVSRRGLCSPCLCTFACAGPTPGLPPSGPLPPAGEFLRPQHGPAKGPPEQASPDPPQGSQCLSVQPHSPHRVCSSPSTDPVLSLSPVVAPGPICLPL